MGTLREQVRAALAGIQRPREPVILDRVGLIRKLEDRGTYTFQIRERLDTGRTRTYPPIEVYSLVEAAMMHEDIVLVTDAPAELARCPVLKTPIVREPDPVLYHAVDSPTRDVIRSNTFHATRLTPRATVAV